MEKKCKNTKTLDEVFCELYKEADDIRDYMRQAFELYTKDEDYRSYYRALDLSSKAKKLNLKDYNITLEIAPDISSLIKFYKAVGAELTA